MKRDASTTDAAKRRGSLLREKSIFLDALDRPTGEREAFVRRAAEGETALADRVLRLLASEADDAREADVTFSLDWSQLQSPGEPEPPRRLDTSEGTLIGDYELTGLLGRGGFGEVWQARQHQPVQRDVAIKIMTGLAGVADPRFALERQALARLDHVGISRILDAGTFEDAPYLVVELAPGKPITTYCDSANLNVPGRLKLFARACRAVHHAHQRGLIHNDLKPANLLVWDKPGEAEPHLKVIDFGVAAVLNLSGGSTSEQLGGTPTFMAPEAAGEGRPVDIRSDVFSLGLTLHAMLGGQNPVAAMAGSRGRRAMLKAAASAPRPEPVKTLSARPLPPEANWIIDAATSPDPEHRYESAAELADEIERLLDRRPIERGPGGRWYRLRRHAVRQKPLVAAAALLLVTVVGGTIATAVQAFRATRAEKLAIEERDAAIEQRRIADEAKNAADSKAREAEATSRFLQRVLFGARPSYEDAEAGKVFMRSVERARDGLRTDLAEFPATRSELLDMIGMVYFENGYNAEAEPMLREAWTMRASLYGDDDPRTLRSAQLLAIILGGLPGRQDEAQTLNEAVLVRARQRGLADDHPVVANAELTRVELLLLNDDAASIDDLVRHAEASEPLLRSEAIVSMDRVTMLRHIQTVSSAGSILSQSTDEVTRKRGVAWSELAYEVAKRVDDREAKIPMAFELAGALRADGQWPRALEVLRETVPLAEQTFGPGHPDTLRLIERLLELRAVYETVDRPAEEIEALVADLRQLMKRGFATGRFLGASSLLIVLHNDGRHEEAYKLALRVLDSIPETHRDFETAEGLAKAIASEVEAELPDASATWAAEYRREAEEEDFE